MTKERPSPVLLQAHLLGLIDNSRLVKWADACIAKLENPDDWLIELSSCPPRTRAEMQSLFVAHGASAVVNDEVFLGLIAYAHANSSMTLQAIHDALMTRFCYAESSAMTPLARNLYVFDDEMDWDEHRARQTLDKILAPYLHDIEDLLK